MPIALVILLVLVGWFFIDAGNPGDQYLFTGITALVTAGWNIVEKMKENSKK